MRAVVIENTAIEFNFHYSVYDEIIELLEIPKDNIGCFGGKEIWNMGYLLNNERLFQRVRNNYESMMGSCDFIDNIYNYEYEWVCVS